MWRRLRPSHLFAWHSFTWQHHFIMLDTTFIKLLSNGNKPKIGVERHGWHLRMEVNTFNGFGLLSEYIIQYRLNQRFTNTLAPG